MGWREGVDENEMVGNAVYVPEDNQELEDLPEEDQEKAWLELQQVLRNIRSSQAAPGPQYNLGPEYSAEQEPASQDQIIFVSPEDLYLNKGIPLEYSPDILPRQEDLPDLPLYNFSPPEDLPLPDQDAYYPPPPPPNSDYINASTVMDHDPRNPAYIITQGPMTHTVADFWQMVWEQGSVVIVMLSRLSENGYQLAQRYWPEEGSEQYHIFEVHLVSEHVWCEDYLVRSLYLKNSQTGETRTVTQFHFLSWPDSNIPTSTKAILEFRRKVNKSYRGRSCPMIVHCSDGVGRSGTYVLIDMVLNRMMKGSKEIDIAATLEHIRDQRSGMVQTRSQFEFCLMAVAEETHAILKALPQ